MNRRKHPQNDKEYLRKPVANIIPNDERQNGLTLKLGTRQECHVSPTVILYVLEALTS